MCPTAVTVANLVSTERPLLEQELDDRIKVLEDTFLQGSAFGSPGPNARSMQALNARMERLEQIVRSDSSIESMAQV